MPGARSPRLDVGPSLQPAIRGDVRVSLALLHEGPRGATETEAEPQKVRVRFPEPPLVQLAARSRWDAGGEARRPAGDFGGRHPGPNNVDPLQSSDAPRSTYVWSGHQLK